MEHTASGACTKLFSPRVERRVLVYRSYFCSRPRRGILVSRHAVWEGALSGRGLRRAECEYAARLSPTEEMVCFFIEGRGEVSWEVMALKLDRMEAAMWGTHAWVLLAKLDIADVREIIRFLELR